MVWELLFRCRVLFMTVIVMVVMVRMMKVDMRTCCMTIRLAHGGTRVRMGHRAQALAYQQQEYQYCGDGLIHYFAKCADKVG